MNQFLIEKNSKEKIKECEMGEKKKIIYTENCKNIN